MLKISVAWSPIVKQLNPALDGPCLPPSDPACRLPHPALRPGSTDMTYMDMNWLPCPAASGRPTGSLSAKGSVKSGYLLPLAPCLSAGECLYLPKFPGCTQQSLFWPQELLPAGALLGLEEVRELTLTSPEILHHPLGFPYIPCVHLRNGPLPNPS